jgi:hypothetical protein
MKRAFILTDQTDMCEFLFIYFFALLSHIVDQLAPKGKHHLGRSNRFISVDVGSPLRSIHERI